MMFSGSLHFTISLKEAFVICCFKKKLSTKICSKANFRSLFKLQTVQVHGTVTLQSEHTTTLYMVQDLSRGS